MLTFQFSKAHNVFVFPFSEHQGLSFHIQYSGFDDQILSPKLRERTDFASENRILLNACNTLGNLSLKQ